MVCISDTNLCLSIILHKFLIEFTSSIFNLLQYLSIKSLGVILFL